MESQVSAWYPNTKSRLNKYLLNGIGFLILAGEPFGRSGDSLKFRHVFLEQVFQYLVSSAPLSTRMDNWRTTHCTTFVSHQSVTLAHTVLPFALLQSVCNLSYVFLLSRSLPSTQSGLLSQGSAVVPTTSFSCLAPIPVHPPVHYLVFLSCFIKSMFSWFSLCDPRSWLRKPFSVDWSDHFPKCAVFLFTINIYNFVSFFWYGSRKSEPDWFSRSCATITKCHRLDIL